MAYSLQFTLIAVIALASGLFFGKAPQRWKPLRRLAVGGGVTLFFCLIFIGSIWVDYAPCREWVIYFVEKWHGCFIPEDDYMSRNVVFILGPVVAGITGVFALLAFLLYFIAFNCRRTEKNLVVACAGAFLAGMVLYLGCPLVFSGMSALFWLTIKELDSLSFDGLITGGVLLAAVVAGWTLLSFRSKKRGWKVLLLRLGAFTAVFPACWILSFAVVFFYGIAKAAQVEKAGVTPWDIVDELPPKLQAEQKRHGDFRDTRPDFELPYEGIYAWRGSKGELISEAKRAYTVKWFDSPEYLAFCAEREALLRKMADGGYCFPKFGLARSCARIHCGRAALFYETGQPEKIIPELMKWIAIEESVFQGQPSLMDVLVQNAIRNMWNQALVMFGPDDSRYAPVYREALNRMKALRVRVPNDDGFLLGQLERALHFRNSGSAGWIGEPTRVAIAAAELERNFRQKETLTEFERLESFNTLPEPKGMSLRNFRNVALKSRISLALGRVGLALKLYRVEKGSYPDQLDKLVPEYLEKIPPCPYTGEPLRYTSDGKNFTLSLRQNEKVHVITSVPEY